VKVIFTSEDVLHDLFIPAFRVKADAVPGRYSAIWFNATKVGEYHLFCAEYCGTRHSGMIGTVYVMEPNDYEAWLSSAANASLATTTGVTTLRQRGASLFTQLSCGTCHAADGTGRGPSLVGVFGSKIALADGTTVTADEDYLRESILNSQRRTVAGYQQLMPTFQGIVTEEDLASLIEYIKSMQPPPRQVAAAEAK
jgi:cytochrome c oxidase subunit 2